jgi:hypothetical protein
MSHKLQAFDIRNRSSEDWDRFYAATDTLLDVGTALAEFSAIERIPTILERYGYLQALVIQQQAVEELSTSVGLKWNPRSDESLRHVRELRDRIAGHPAWSEKKEAWKYERSSAMQDLSRQSPYDFRVTLYHKGYSKDLTVTFAELLRMNEAALSEQLGLILVRMHEIEDEFRTKTAPNDAL